ncbi:hypothetical protein SPB21_01555 [Leptothoe sp. ISB3NOV94-8A]
MIESDRLVQLEKNIRRLRNQISGKEDILITIAPEEKVRIKQQIDDLRSELLPFEEEYWSIFARHSNSLLQISEDDAEIVVSEIISQIKVIEVSQTEKYSREVLTLLKEIKEQLSQPETAAEAKLKGMISSIPPFIGVSYEAELDTERFFQKYFPTFRRLISSAVKKS